MSWTQVIQVYKAFLMKESFKRKNTIEAYMHDIQKLLEFCEFYSIDVTPYSITTEHLQSYLQWIVEMGYSPETQARNLAGIKYFFKFMFCENLVKSDISEVLQYPVTGCRLPEILTIAEIENLISAVDIKTPEGFRNRAMIEVLYSTGVKPGELLNLHIHDVDFINEVVTVHTIENGYRTIPIGYAALKAIERYLNSHRNYQEAKPGNQAILFLNRRGEQLTTAMLYHVVTALAKKINLTTYISPGTFRNTFIVHMLQGGANLRAVQQIVGHESILQTEKYQKLNTSYLRSQMNINIID